MSIIRLDDEERTEIEVQITDRIGGVWRASWGEQPIPGRGAVLIDNDQTFTITQIRVTGDEILLALDPDQYRQWRQAQPIEGES